MTGRREFERVMAQLEASGACGYIESLLRPDGAGGRPRQLSVAVFLTAVVCAVDEKQGALSLVRVHHQLTQGLARSYRVQLGITTLDAGGTDRSISLRQVRYMLEAIETKLAFSEGRVPDLADDDRANRADALQRVLDLIVAGSIPDHLPAPESWALDGTAVESWGKGRRRGPVDPDADHAQDDDLMRDGTAVAVQPLFDVDARWGYQTKTYDNKTNLCYGYHVFGMVGLLPVGADPDLRPKLTERISIRPANANAIVAALTMIDSLNAANRHVRELLSDREFSYKSEQSWAQPLRQRGVSQVMDLHPNDRGIRDYNGIAMMDGVPYCSAALANRPDLVNIARPERFSAPPLKANASVEEREEHDRVTAQIAEFNRLKSEPEQRAFRRVAGPDADGNERYECPAQAGKLICANCPFSLNFLDGVPVVEKPHALPALPVRPVRLDSSATAAEREQYRQDLDRYNTQADFLRCCRQRTITIPGTVTPKTRQKLAWGSEDWQESYKRRTHVEGAFGNWKSPKTSRVQRGWIYVVGLVKTGIMIACVAFATNMRLLRRWSERTGDITDPLTKPLPESLGFEELDADGNLDLADGPPGA